MLLVFKPSSGDGDWLLMPSSFSCFFKPNISDRRVSESLLTPG